MLSRVAVSIALVVGALAVDVRTTRACSRMCELHPGILLPLEGGSIPANAAAFPFFRNLDLLEDATLTRLDDGSSIEVALETADGLTVVRPLTPLLPGSHRTRLTTSCSPPVRVQDILVGEGVPVPDRIGELRATPPRPVGLAVDAGGMCYGQSISIGADVEVLLDPSARAWADVWIWSTLVDDTVYAPQDGSGGGADAETGAYAGGSWRGRGRDLIHAGCEASPETAQRGLTEGRHRVKMQARLAGTDVVLETNEVEIELVCADHDLEEIREFMAHDACSAGGTGGLASVGLVSIVLLLRSRSSRRVRRRRAMVRAR